VQPVPITTEVVSSNPVHGEVYSIQHYKIKFVSDRSVVFSGYSDSEILLKVTLNTITHQTIYTVKLLNLDLEQGIFLDKMKVYGLLFSGPPLIRPPIMQ
jgi:predicted phosphoadenosine phosphosulfate sulfurtransferase